MSFIGQIEEFSKVVGATIEVFSDSLYNVLPIRGCLLIVYYHRDKKIHIRAVSTITKTSIHIKNALNVSVNYQGIFKDVIFDPHVPQTLYAIIDSIPDHARVVGWKGNNSVTGSTICFDIYETYNLVDVLACLG